jgi:dCMP deaminase
MNKKWHQRFLKLAFEVASWSKDPSSQVGAVITKKKKVISLGYNGPPANVDDNPSMSREVKYRRTIHAEVNALLTSHRSLKGCTIYTTHHPCSQCAAKLIQAGIKRVICPEPSVDFMSRWKDDIDEAQLMFNEAKIKLRIINAEI